MEFYLWFDIVCVICTTAFIHFRCKLTFYHPGTWFLFYHIFTNTFRFFAIANGSNLLFSSSISLQGATVDELTRAIFWADLSLVTAGILIVAAEGISMRQKPYLKVINLNNKLLWSVLIFSIPIGIYGALTQLYIPTITTVSNITNTAETESSYTAITQSWFGLSMMALIFFHGFKKVYVIPLVVYLLVIALQGYFRYRLILPIIFLAATYLAANNLKWPLKKHMVVMLALVFLFYPLKNIGKIVQAGGGINEIEDAVVNSFNETSNGDNGDQAFLDQYAMTLTELDNKGEFYYGTTLLPIFISPIPRSWWKDKPALNQWQIDISSKYRRFTEIGSVGTIYGESYANFGYIGILILPGLLFFVLTRWYNKVLQYPKKSVNFFFYLLIISCIIQIMRDGLISLFVFPVIDSLPLFLIYLLHKVFIKPQLLKNVKKRKNNSYRDIAATV